MVGRLQSKKTPTLDFGATAVAGGDAHPSGHTGGRDRVVRAGQPFHRSTSRDDGAPSAPSAASGGSDGHHPSAAVSDANEEATTGPPSHCGRDRWARGDESAGVMAKLAMAGKMAFYLRTRSLCRNLGTIPM